MGRRLRRLWLGAPLPRALLDAAGGAVLLALLLLAGLAAVPSPTGQVLVLGASLPTIGVLGACIGAARLRLPPASRAQRLRRELGASVAFSLTLSAVILGVVAAAAWLAPGGPITGPSLAGALVSVALLLGVYGVLRAAVLAWSWWDQLRQTRLLWALTHAQLAISFLFAVGGAALAVPLLFASGDLGSAAPPGTPPLAEFVVRLAVRALPVLAGYLALIVLGTALSLPLALLTSWLFIRPITRRLETLAAATGALRQGALAVRVPVAGRDEVARLQTDFNAMAADLERTLDDLQRERDTVALLLQRRRELVAAVSHELRTPVATLRGYLESTLGRWEGAPPPTLRGDLEVMDREAERLGRLIDDLFTLARAEADGLPLDRRPTDVAALIARSVAATAPGAWERRRVEVLDHAPAAPVLALADAGRLEQVLHNLIGNAVRHTPPGGVVLLTAAGGGEGVTLEVRDTGEGIAPDDLPRVFERFYRSDGARSREPAGAGLGLALVKELVEAMGGSVAVTSAPGEGATFTLRLPAAPCDNPATVR